MNAGPPLARLIDNKPVNATANLAQRIHAALPQTQCTRCGYPDCAAYAQAIAAGEAAINQCPPGGAEGIERLAAITGLPGLPLNPVNGLEGPRSVAIIDEAWCIGCTLCLDACPADAILGSNKLMHTVIEPHCTGCELCIPVCPVDCISLENVTGERTGWQAWSAEDAKLALQRYGMHNAHRQLKKSGAQALPANAATADTRLATATPQDAHPEKTTATMSETDRKRAMIEAALARARAKARQ